MNSMNLFPDRMWCWHQLKIYFLNGVLKFSWISLDLLLRVSIWSTISQNWLWWWPTLIMYQTIFWISIPVMSQHRSGKKELTVPLPWGPNFPLFFCTSITGPSLLCHHNGSLFWGANHSMLTGLNLCLLMSPAPGHQHCCLSTQGLDFMWTITKNKNKQKIFNFIMTDLAFACHIHWNLIQTYA